MPELRRILVRIDPSMVYFLRFILEGYDNLFMATTLDKTTGLVAILLAEGAREDLDAILRTIPGCHQLNPEAESPGVGGPAPLVRA